jgi:predicted nucleic acid-binding Zn ribbon protein
VRLSRDDPRPLRDALDEVSAELGLVAPETFETVCRHWDELVGRDLSAHATPRSLRDGVLTVSVDDAPWATRLRYLETDVVTRANELVTPGAVTAMRTVVQRDPGAGRAHS